MAEETEVVQVETKEIPLDQATPAEYKKARTEGKDTVTREVKAAESEPEAQEQEETPKPKAKGGFQARIDRLVKQAAAAEERATAAEKKAAEAEAKAGKTEEKTASPANGEPKRENFQTEEAYLRAVIRWEARQEMIAEREAEEQRQAAEEHKEAVLDYNRRAIESEAKHDDWKEVVSNNQTPVPTAVGTAIMFGMKNGPEVAYFLGKHPEICEEMFGVHETEAIAMAYEISKSLDAEEKGDESEGGEVEEEPEKAAAAVEKKAPPPIRTVAGGKTRSTMPLDKVDFQAYKKLRQQGRVQ